MENATGILRACLWLALVLPMLAMAACSPSDTSGMRFDIPAQPAGQALNEFAKQADITLIFSYDLVKGDRTRALHGRYTVDHALTMLLQGTRLTYRQAADGTYLICPKDACVRSSEPSEQPSFVKRKVDANQSSGNTSAARLRD